MKQKHLIKAAWAGLISATLVGNLSAEESAPGEHGNREQAREHHRNAAPERREAVREPFRNLTPEQRDTVMRRLREMPPERRQALRERFQNASPEQREALKQRLQQPLPERRDTARQAPGDAPNRDQFRPRRRSGGPGMGAGGPPSPEEREKMISERRERGQARLAELRKELAAGSLTPDEQRQLARLEQWERQPGRGPGTGEGRGSGRREPGPREGGRGPAPQR